MQDAAGDCGSKRQREAAREQEASCDNENMNSSSSVKKAKQEAEQEDWAKFFFENEAAIVEEAETAKSSLKDSQVDALIDAILQGASSSGIGIMELLRSACARFTTTEITQDQRDRTTMVTNTAQCNAATSSVGGYAFAVQVIKLASGAACDGPSWKSLMLIINKNHIYYGDGETPSDMLSRLQQDWETNEIYKVSVSITGTNLYHFAKPFQLNVLDSIFLDQLGKLKAFLESKVLPLMDSSKGYDLPDITKPKLEYVRTTQDRVSETFQALLPAPDKAFALVVAGESGSGKSVYSCLLPRKKDFMVLYVVLHGTDFEKNPKPNKFEYPKLNKLIHVMINDMEKGQHIDNTDILRTMLYETKEKLNVNRNEWAKRLLHGAIKRVLGGDALASDWYNGWLVPEKRPAKLALVVDEATDVDLVEGLIEGIREIKADLFQRLARDDFCIILTGTGLDAIRYPNRVGTNPDLSKLTILESPNFTKMVEDQALTPTVANAVKAGKFSRVLSTNSRMFFRAVLPIMTMQMHTLDNDCKDSERDNRLQERLQNIGSFRDLMDFAPRMYVASNSIAFLESSDKSGLLKRAFLYHMEKSVRSCLESAQRKDLRAIVQQELDAVVRDAESVIENVSQSRSDEIFTRGLARREGTSAALKYLACFGLACELRPAFGDEFEELVALHYMRWMQVKGYSTHRAVLKHAWPPKSVKKSIGIDDIAELKAILKVQEKDEFPGFDFSLLDKKACVIFSQGSPTAQGGDVLALVVNQNRTCLDIIQCKHYAESPGKKAVGDWWRSLGIVMDVNGVDDTNFQPEEGSGGYSLAGIEAFRALLEKKLELSWDDVSVELGTRILAASFKTPQRVDFPFPTTTESGRNHVRVWFREMLEPTISVVSLRASVDRS